MKCQSMRQPDGFVLLRHTGKRRVRRMLKDDVPSVRPVA